MTGFMATTATGHRKLATAEQFRHGNRPMNQDFMYLIGRGDLRW